MFFWDGRTKTLEEQLLEPIANPVEMGSTVADAVKRLQADPGYRKQFAAAFDDGITPANLASPGELRRQLLRGDSPIDKFRERGNRDAMTPAERTACGFTKARVSAGSATAARTFPMIVPQYRRELGRQDLGRHVVTKSDADRGKYKTPSSAALSSLPVHARWQFQDPGRRR